MAATADQEDAQTVAGLSETAESYNRVAPADEVRPYYPAWTQVPVLDAAFVGLAIARNCEDIARLSTLDKISSREFNAPSRLAQFGMEQLPDVVLNDSFVEPKTGRSRIHQYDESGPCAVDVAFRLATAAGSEAMEPARRLKKWIRLLEADARLILDMVEEAKIDSRTGIAFAALQGGTPTIFGTFATISAWREYRQLRRWLPSLPTLRMPLEDVIEGLFRDEFVYSDGNVFAFKRPSAPVGCLSTTEYAYRIAAIITEESRSSQIRRLVGGRLAEHRSHVLNFLRLCWDDNSGGFRPNPNSQSVPNLGHTRQALQLIRSLLKNDPPSGDLHWLDPGRVLRFVLSCWSEEHGVAGFVNVPGLPFPTLCSERAAVNAYKLCEVFTKVGDLRGDAPYRDAAGLVQAKLSRVLPFVESCLQEDTSYAYPAHIIARAPRERQVEAKRLAKAAERRVSVGESKSARIVSVLAAISVAAAAPEYTRSVWAASTQLQHAFENDLRTLCFANRDGGSAAAPFPQTAKLLSNWPRLLLDQSYVKDHSILEELRGTLVDQTDDGSWYLLVSLDAILDRIPEQGFKQFKLLEPGSRGLDVLRTAHAVFEAGRLAFTRTGAGDVHVFSSFPRLLLPEAAFNDARQFKKRLGWESTLLPRDTWVAPGSADNYFDAIRRGPADRRIFYSWNRTIAARLLRIGYESAPAKKRRSYLQAVADLLKRGMQQERVVMGTFDGAHLNGERGIGLRDVIAYIDSLEIIFVLRNPKTHLICTGIRMSTEIFRTVIQKVIGSEAELTPIGEILLWQWWNHTHGALPDLAQILMKDTTPIRATGDVELSAWWVIADHMDESLSDRVALGAIARYNPESVRIASGMRKRTEPARRRQLNSIRARLAALGEPPSQRDMRGEIAKSMRGQSLVALVVNAQDEW